jgi:CRISPR/Cas system-associated exonuclease Cas4 (RecB family)
MIRTIDDLLKADSREVEEIRSTINLRGYYYTGVKRNGSEEGLTLDEYEAWQEEEPDLECGTCHGGGKVKKYHRSVGTIHASSAHGCIRRLYYDADGSFRPKQKIKPELMITFSMGHAIHDVVQKALHTALPGQFRDEVRVDLPEAFVSNSRTDGVVDLPQTRVLLEIKSMGAEFDRLQAPKKEHLIQAVGIYATALDTPFISFLYVAKKWPHSVKEFVVPYDPKIYRRWWKNKGSRVEAALEEGKPPIADATKDQCNFCPYAYFCEHKL